MLPGAACAATSAKDVAVAVRALGFSEPRLTPAAEIVILYEAGDEASEADAKAIRGGVSGRGAVRLAPSSELSSISGARVVFLAAGVRNQPAIFAAASRQRAVTISSDMNCVKEAHCVIGVKAQPTVQIVVSRSAREASNVRFSQAFLMLVREQ